MIITTVITSYIAMIINITIKMTPSSPQSKLFLRSKPKPIIIHVEMSVLDDQTSRTRKLFQPATA